MPSVITSENSLDSDRKAGNHGDENGCPKSSPLDIPTIDISGYLKDPDSPAAQAIIPLLREACRSTGFFQVVGHGISKDLQRSVFEGAKAFFDLPMKTKKSIDLREQIGRRGYDILSSQSYKEGTLPDLKESFVVGEDIPMDDPRVAARRHFMGQNVWPNDSTLPRETFRDPVERYHTAICSLSVQILRMIEDSLPYGRGVFKNFVSNNPMTPMRILHYPPARPDSDGRQYGASPHTDFGAIAVLLQDGTPGLELWDPNSNSWVNIPPNPDAYVVNIGDMLSFWTKGHYVSSLHRVVNNHPWDRYSIVLLYHGNSDTELIALDGSEKNTETPLTVEQHVLKRLKKSYGDKFHLKESHD